MEIQIRFIAAALALSFILPVGAVAGTITFFDLSDKVTFTDTSGRVSPVNCAGGATCILDILAPQGATFPNLSCSLGNNCQPFIEDPEGVTISDRITATQSNNPFRATISFFSDTDEIVGLGLCASVGGCTSREDGTVQPAFTIEWRNDAGVLISSDTIKFQSDVDVPEPSLILLTLGGFAMLSLAMAMGRRGFCLFLPVQEVPMVTRFQVNLRVVSVVFFLPLFLPNASAQPPMGPYESRGVGVSIDVQRIASKRHNNAFLYSGNYQCGTIPKDLRFQERPDPILLCLPSRSCVTLGLNPWVGHPYQQFPIAPSHLVPGTYLTEIRIFNLFPIPAHISYRITPNGARQTVTLPSEQFIFVSCFQIHPDPVPDANPFAEYPAGAAASYGLITGAVVIQSDIDVDVTEVHTLKNVVLEIPPRPTTPVVVPLVDPLPIVPNSAPLPRNRD